MSGSVKSLPNTPGHEPLNVPKSFYSTPDTNMADTLGPLEQAGVDAPEADTPSNMRSAGDMAPVLPDPVPAPTPTPALQPEPEPKQKSGLELKEVVEKAKGEIYKAKDWMENNKGATAVGAAGLGFAGLVAVMALLRARRERRNGRARGKRVQGRLARRAFEEDERGLLESALEDPQFLGFLEEMVWEMDDECQ